MKIFCAKRNLLLPIALLLSAALLSPYAPAQNTIPWGTNVCPAGKTMTPQASTTALATIKPFVSFPQSGFGTGGVALRNRGAGNISVSGVVGAAKAALIYWAVITNGPPAAPESAIQVQQLFPAVSPNVTLPGIVVGSGTPPCWPGTVITVFRARIPPAVATGNGSYQITLNKGASGLTNGSDPWLGAPVLPLFEGASMVMVGDGAGTVAIYDTGLAGNTFTASPAAFMYSLVLPVAAPGNLTLLDNIGADGQQGSSRTSIFATEATTINGVNVAGPGSTYNDSDWNGSSGYPIPQLWDDTGHDITKATPAGTAMLNVAITDNPGGDCLTPVANVVQVQ